MLFDIIIIGIAATFIFLFFKQKDQLTKLKKQIVLLKNKKSPHEIEEFSLGLKKLNSDFTDTIPTDSLTGLPGRDAFNDRLSQAFSQSKRFEKSFALILLDINEFQLINNAKGYDVGDLLLKDVAKRLQGVTRQIDTMTRYAGNTFIFLLPQLALPETAAYVAQRLLDNIVQPFQINNENIYISANVGVAIYPHDGHDTKSILRNADEALRQAKSSGKNRYQFYHQELHALGQRELELRTILSNENVLEKLVIHYHPLTNIKTGKVIFLYANPVINLPEFGLVPFSEFAKTAENCGKITAIGTWLLKNALLKYKQWHDTGSKPEFLAMNVTLRQIEDPIFISNVADILQELAIKPQQIVFEITEKNLAANINSLDIAFSMLTELGIQTAVSVFTLGQLALQKINKLPINYLKIDGKLIHGKKSLQENEAILHLIIDLAKDMQIKIIAEGVDTANQKKLLEDLGCDVMQGQFFAKGIPVEL